MEFVLDREKTCPRCGITKSIGQFTIRKSGPRTGQPVAHCKACNTSISVERQKNDDTLYRRVQWPSKLRRMYGLEVEDYFALLDNQGGCCAICKAKTPGNRHYKRNGKIEMFHVDHCHATGLVRGLLCGSCNRAIGYLKDDPELALRVSEYLSSTQT